jgi:hypothetical protein
VSQLACLLCGSDIGEVTVRLVEWREPIAGRRYEHLPRCRDVEGCWSRVTSVLVEDWAVNDGRPARAYPEPLHDAEPPPADAPELMEEPEWLVS